MRRRNHPHVGAARLGFAHALVFALLKQTKQLRLNLKRQISDLVEEERSSVGCGNLTLRVGVRARECPFDVAKQLAFQELAREAWAAHGNERRQRFGGCVGAWPGQACSYPVPLSPRSSTVASLSAALKAMSRTLRISPLSVLQIRIRSVIDQP